MKIIFLDVDGVFVTSRSWLGTRKKRSGMASEFDPIALEIIRKLCERTESKIVISSTWRKISVLESGSENKNNLYNTFKKAGLIEYVFMPSWRTVSLDFETRPNDFPSIEKWKGGREIDEYCLRGDEIDRWLKHNGKDVEKYCIIDDDYDFTDYQIENHLVHTDTREGFLYRDYEKAVRILGLSKKEVDESDKV